MTDGTKASELLPLAEAGRIAGLHQDTLRNQIHNGRLTARKLGNLWFVTQTELDTYLGSRPKRKPRKRKP